MRILALFLVLNCYFLSAGESYPEAPDYVLLSKLADPNLKVGRTKVIFQLNDIEPNKGTIKVVWSANKMIDTISLTNKREISETLISGKYNFKFYYNSIYREIIIPRIILESGYVYTISLHFKPERRENITVKKPVIYFYPEEETKINVKLKTRGELTFTYPIYSPSGWNFTAAKNGEITYDEQDLNYLFWESDQDPTTISADLSRGFILDQKDVISFLEEKLNDFGLNSKEKADFITFWGPQLIRNERNFIHFVVNEEADQFAELEISPKPDHVYRIYLLFRPLEHEEMPELQEQVLPRMDRNGFTVIEWGGSELTQIGL